MAFVAIDATDSSRLRRPVGMGDRKMQLMTYTCLSTDTSGTVTADGLTEITQIQIDGLVQTALATFAGNVATLAFNAPGGTTVAGSITCWGV